MSDVFDKVKQAFYDNNTSGNPIRNGCIQIPVRYFNDLRQDGKIAYNLYGAEIVWQGDEIKVIPKPEYKPLPFPEDIAPQKFEPIDFSG